MCTHFHLTRAKIDLVGASIQVLINVEEETLLIIIQLELGLMKRFNFVFNPIEEIFKSFTVFLYRELMRAFILLKRATSRFKGIINSVFDMVN
jgi:hypothetical protein